MIYTKDMIIFGLLHFYKISSIFICWKKYFGRVPTGRAVRSRFFLSREKSGQKKSSTAITRAKQLLFTIYFQMQKDFSI